MYYNPTKPTKPAKPIKQFAYRMNSANTNSANTNSANTNSANINNEYENWESFSDSGTDLEYIYNNMDTIIKHNTHLYFDNNTDNDDDVQNNTEINELKKCAIRQSNWLIYDNDCINDSDNDCDDDNAASTTNTFSEQTKTKLCDMASQIARDKQRDSDEKLSIWKSLASLHDSQSKIQKKQQALEKEIVSIKQELAQIQDTQTIMEQKRKICMYRVRKAQADTQDEIKSQLFVNKLLDKRISGTETVIDTLAHTTKKQEKALRKEKKYLDYNIHKVKKRIHYLKRDFENLAI